MVLTQFDLYLELHIQILKKKKKEKSKFQGRDYCMCFVLPLIPDF